MSILRTTYQYFPYPLQERWQPPAVGFDDAKMNLLWLLDPSIDAYYDQPWHGNALSHCIDTEMHPDLRKALNLAPLKFVACMWQHIPSVMADLLPLDVEVTARRRANEAHSRLFGSTNTLSNVVRYDFATRCRVA